MRALISLYHQTETFITPENLSKKIDEAFIKPLTTDRIFEKTGINPPSLMTIDSARLKKPKLSEMTVGRPFQFVRGEALGGLTGVERERRVKEALYGVDLSNPDRVLPGLETLEDEAEEADDWEPKRQKISVLDAYKKGDRQ